MRLRVLFSVGLGLATALFAYATAFGITQSWWESAAIALIAAGLAGHWALRTPHLDLEDETHPRLLKIGAAVTCALALLLVGRVSVFMLDQGRTEFAFLPSSVWENEHSCLTAYHVAAEAARTHGDVYDNALYSATDDDPATPRKPRMLDGFQVDVYEYPPPFLLLPRALHLLAPEFLSLRALWFGLNGLVLLTAFLVVGIQLGPAAGGRALLWSPFVWIAPPTLSMLQKENVQGIILAMSMVAMVLFARKRTAAGGALLAFATVSKLFPGLLVVYLIARREWRAVGWTAAFGVAYAALALVLFGWAPYAAFLDHLPGLMSGEAFPAFRKPMAMAINLGVPGLVFKAKLFGAAAGFGASKILGWLYTLVALGAVVWVARRRTAPEHQVLVWLAILVVATLRSPFLPVAYGVFPVLWLLTLLATLWVARLCRPLVFLAVWLPLAIYWPVDRPADPRWIAILTTMPQLAMVALSVIALRADEAPAIEVASQQPPNISGLS